MMDELLDAKHLAKRLRRARLERGLSLRGAAAKIGVTKETLSDLERARRQPHPPTLAKIANGYGVEISDLLGPIVEEEPVLSGKAEAPDEAGHLTAELTAEQLSPEIKLLQDFNDKLRRDIGEYDEGLTVPDHTDVIKVEALEHTLTEGFKERGLLGAVEAVNEGREMASADVRILSNRFAHELSNMQYLTRAVRLFWERAEGRVFVETEKGTATLDSWRRDPSRERVE